MCSARKVKSALSREAGVSLTELVVAIPVVILMVGTLVDFGLATQRGEEIAEIAKQAARTAAIVSFSDDAPSATTRYVCLPGGSTQKCDLEGSWKEIQVQADGALADDCSIETLPSLDCLAAKEAHGALDASGLGSKDWIVRARTCDYDVNSSPSPHPGVQVEIERSPLAKTCFLCIGQHLAASFTKARSLFAVEGEC
jgi:hypothetical protein